MLRAPSVLQRPALELLMARVLSPAHAAPARRAAARALAACAGRAAGVLEASGCLWALLALLQNDGDDVGYLVHFLPFVPAPRPSPLPLRSCP